MQFTVTASSIEELKDALEQLTGSEPHECKCRAEEVEQPDENPKPKKRTRKKREPVSEQADSKAVTESKDEEADPRPEKVMPFLLLQKSLTETMSEYKGDLVPTEILIELNQKYGVPGAKMVKDTERAQYLNEFRTALGLGEYNGES